MMITDRMEAVLDQIIFDAGNDIKESEGQGFNGKNVHSLFGKQAAAIEALAKINKELIIKIKKLKSSTNFLGQLSSE